MAGVIKNFLLGSFTILMTLSFTQPSIDHEGIRAILDPDTIIRIIEGVKLRFEENRFILSPKKGQDYKISSVSPKNACPGETIFIRGENFGTDGEVLFNVERNNYDNSQTLLFARSLNPYKREPVATKAINWSESEIEVIVPNDARRGNLGLRIPAGDRRFPIGQDILFEGGETKISLLKITELGDHNKIIEPDSDITIQWQIFNSEYIDIEIKTDDRVDEFLWKERYFEEEGSFSLQIPFFEKPTPLEIRAVATKQDSNCRKDVLTTKYMIDHFFSLDNASIQTKPARVSNETIQNSALFALDDEILTFYIKPRYPGYFYFVEEEDIDFDFEYTPYPLSFEDWLPLEEESIQSFNYDRGQGAYKVELKLENFNGQNFFRVLSKQNSYPNYLNKSGNQQEVFVNKSPEIYIFMLQGGSCELDFLGSAFEPRDKHGVAIDELMEEDSIKCRSACNCNSFLKHLSKRLIFSKNVAREVKSLSDQDTGEKRYCDDKEDPIINLESPSNSTIILGRWSHTEQEKNCHESTPKINAILDEYQNDDEIKYLIFLGQSHGGAKIVDMINNDWRWGNNFDVRLLVLWDATDFGGGKDDVGSRPKQLLNFYQSNNLWRFQNGKHVDTEMKLQERQLGLDDSTPHNLIPRVRLIHEITADKIEDTILLIRNQHRFLNPY